MIFSLTLQSEGASETHRSAAAEGQLLRATRQVDRASTVQGVQILQAHDASDGAVSAVTGLICGQRATLAGRRLLQHRRSTRQASASEPANCISAATCYTPHQFQVAYGVEPLPPARNRRPRRRRWCCPSWPSRSSRHANVATSARTSPSSIVSSICRRRIYGSRVPSQGQRSPGWRMER